MRAREDDFLVAAARVVPRSAEAEHMRRLLDGGVDWARLRDKAEHHGVASLLFRSLERLNTPNIPELEPLRWRATASALRNEQLVAGLRRGLDLLAAVGIDAIPYKGPALAVMAYGDPALREFGDLDLLVRDRDFRAAAAALIAAGFAPVARRFSWEVTLVNEGVAVDLHRALTPPRYPVRLDFDAMWARRAPVGRGEARIVTFSPADMLLVLCVQLAKDGWERRLRLLKLCDVAELVERRSDLDWPCLETTARAAGAAGMVDFALGLTADVFGRPTAEAWQRSRPREPMRALIAQAHGELFASSDRETARRYPERAFHRLLRERARDRWLARPRRVVLALRRCAHRLRHPTDEERRALGLPPGLGLLFYAIQPLRLAVHHLVRRWRCDSGPGGSS